MHCWESKTVKINYVNNIKSYLFCKIVTPGKQIIQGVKAGLIKKKFAFFLSLAKKTLTQK
jgi:hypothetical protein